MDSTLIIISIITLIVGYIIGILLSKLKIKQQTSELEKTIAKLKVNISTLETQKSGIQKILDERNKENEQINFERESFRIQLAEKNIELKNLEIKFDEHKDQVSQLEEKFKKDFENLANKILDENSKKFKDQNKESIEGILTPLKEKIEGFEKKVTESQEKSVGMHSALKVQLQGLKDLNQKISKDAINLTKALKGDSKVQGDWGETQLEILLEKAKLTKDIHFTTQGGFRDEEGKLKKPDFIINLPDNRHLIIDAKVSLTDYEAYISSENEIQKEKHLKKHIDSIRKHFKDLSNRKYSDLYEINSPDYVLMFVPIEPAYITALNKNHDLYLEALDKNVVLLSTSTLLATLSTVSSMWRQENQKRNVLAIAEQAGRLYDQFVNLTDDLVKVGTQLKTVRGSYESSMKKLTGRGNLVTKVEKIKELGAKTSKNIKKSLLDRANEE